MIMKQRSTTPVSKGLTTKRIVFGVIALALVLAPTQFTTKASADTYDNQIRAIQREIDEYQSNAQALSKEADTLSNQLSILSNQKSIIQSEINVLEAKRNKLNNDITETEKKIGNNRDALGETIADMYLDDGISPLEMLASSNNIGDYVDKQEFRAEIRDNLTGTIDEIVQLQKKLQGQKVAVERTLLDQENSRKALVDKENEQQAILTETNNKESAYRELSSSRQADKKRIQQEQQAAIEAAMNRGGGGGSLNISGGDGSMGGYPWAGNCYVDSNAWSHGGSNGNGEDPLGYGCRQCVSYTAWKMFQNTPNNYAPSYWGNANMWPASARAAKFTVTRTPREKSIGVISAGQYGHVVYIESYNQSNNTVNISQFNYWNAGGSGWGHYSEMKGVPASTYDTFIYL